MKRTLLWIGLAAAPAIVGPTSTSAAGRDAVIGDIDDLSGVYSDVSGPGAAEAMKMAVADFGGTVLGRKIVTLVADHQNKPDIGASKFREWTDQSGLNMLLGEANTGVSIAIAKITATKKVPFFPISVSMATFLDGDSVVGGRVS